MSTRLGKFGNPTADFGDLVSGNGSQATYALPVAQSIMHHHHKGHRRGHSYGGPITQTSSGSHHPHLEARPSHPNAHHAATSHGGGPVVHKGHRRALSGCLPMVGMGAVAWSSLRELESPLPPLAYPAVRSFSPEESRPATPDTTVADGRAAPKTVPPFTGSTSKSDLHSLECGIGPFRLPRCFQGLANIKFFVCILALLVTLQQAVASGYVNSVITTIETRFEIPARFMGIVASAYEMGNVITVLFVSYLGAKRHVPRWIATGVIVMVIGCIVFTLPHFLASDYNQSVSQTSSNRINRLDFAGNPLNGTGLDFLKGRNSECKSANPMANPYVSGPSKYSTPVDDKASSVERTSDVVQVQKNVYQERDFFSVGCTIESIDEHGNQVTETRKESYAQPFILFMLAQLLLGCGGSPLFTLGITYIDDHVEADSSSLYIGIVYAMAAFGPVLGFLTGALLLSIRDTAVQADTAIGTWWGGFLVAGVLLFIVCLPFFTFPKLMSTKSKEEETETKETPYSSLENSAEGSSVTQLNPSGSESTEYGQSIRDIPRGIWRLITNPTYVITCLGGCMELNIVSAFIVFLPKYLETQFSLGKSEASLYTGGIAIPGACLGIFVGGFVMKKMQLTPSGAAKFVVGTNLVCLLGYTLFFFLGCENPKLAGATVPYPDSFDPTGLKPMEVNLTSTCNLGCACDSSLDAQFVCYNGTTFFSPCHAGCSANYSQCTCARGNSVTPGKCSDSKCHTLEAFMIILFFMTGTVAITQMPLLMIVMRSVAVEERSFALGMQFVIFRLFGYIPSPIIFGNVIDSACILWSIKKCPVLPAVSGRCLLYDVQDFRYKYVGTLTGIKLLALALFLYDYYILRKAEKKEERENLAATVALHAENSKLRSNSVISLDKLFEEGETDGGRAATSAVAT